MRIGRKTREEVGRLITVSEAAARVGVTPMRIRQLIGSGRLESFCGRVDPDDLGLFSRRPLGPGRPRSGRRGDRSPTGVGSRVSI